MDKHQPEKKNSTQVRNFLKVKCENPSEIKFENSCKEDFIRTEARPPEPRTVIKETGAGGLELFHLLGPLSCVFYCTINI